MVFLSFFILHSIIIAILFCLCIFVLYGRYALGVCLSWCVGYWGAALISALHKHSKATGWLRFYIHFIPPFFPGLERRADEEGKGIGRKRRRWDETVDNRRAEMKKWVRWVERMRDETVVFLLLSPLMMILMVHDRWRAFCSFLVVFYLSSSSSSRARCILYV